jgi:hypothetical protein
LNGAKNRTNLPYVNFNYNCCLHSLKHFFGFLYKIAVGTQMCVSHNNWSIYTWHSTALHSDLCDKRNSRIFQQFLTITRDFSLSRKTTKIAVKSYNAPVYTHNRSKWLQFRVILVNDSHRIFNNNVWIISESW